MLFLINIFQYIDYSLFVVLLGIGFLGLATGVLGCFVLVRQQSLLSDTVSHASLPGICIAFLIVKEKSIFSFLLGAIICAGIAYLFIKLILHFTKLKQDAALGIVLSVFFGFGLSLLSYVQNSPDSGKSSGLDSFFFGDVTSFTSQDVIVMAIFSIVCVSCVVIFWKQFKIIVFNKQYAQSLGLNIKFFEFLLSLMIVVAIVLGIQVVGFILVGAMLIISAVSARQYSNTWGKVLLISVILNIIGVFSASYLSFTYSIATGPLVVVFLSVILVLSLLFAPCNGIVWGKIRHYKNRKDIKDIMILKNFLHFRENHIDPFHPHNIEVFSVWKQVPLKSRLLSLKLRGLLIEHSTSQWSISLEGIKYVKKN